MRLLCASILGLACLVLPGVLPSRPLLSQEPAAPLLPPESTWKMRFDAQLDGVLKDPLETPVGTMTVRNNRIVATAMRFDIKDTMTGEIVPGADGGFPIVMLRQDGDMKPKGFVVFYTGRLVEPGKIVGTWVNNHKAAGDFELVMVNK